MILARLIAVLVGGPAKTRREGRVRALVAQGETLLEAGDPAGAEQCYLRAIDLDPAASAPHGRLALLLTGLGRTEQALSHFSAAQRAKPIAAELIESYVRLLLSRGEYEEAERAARDTARASPASHESWFALGLALHASHQYAPALECYDKALAFGRRAADLHANRGITLQNLGRLQDAIHAYDRALDVAPEHALARFHRSLAVLMQGDYAAGWPDYETRLRSAELRARPRSFPRWDGARVAGRTLLVYGEQGLGDEIMFASCLPDLHRAGARCIVECNPALHALFARSFPQAIVYPAARDKRMPDDVAALGIDFEVPSGSLPLHFRGSREAFPAAGGYLRADAGRIEAWRARLRELGPGLMVGISWKGGTHASRASLRSIALEQWVPIFRTPGVRFVSVQYSPDAEADLDSVRRSHGIDITHWREAMSDYDETAALVSALDLTISVCTAVVHLAGALGRPVWVLAPTNPEWRYGHADDVMPWYPSSRVFRQQRERDWSGVLTTVAGALHDLAAASGEASTSSRSAAQAHNREGLVKLGAGDFSGAQGCFERALEAFPQLAEAHCNLGLVLLEQGNGAAGERHLRQAIELDGQLLAARENLALRLTASFDHEQAGQAWDEVLALNPTHANAHAAKAFLALREGRFDDARCLGARALELGADRAGVLLHEAGMLAFEGHVDAAKRLLLSLRGCANPVSVDWELGLCALSQGDFAEGWPLYEARLRKQTESPARPYTYPEWDGSPLGDGALLILGEQGLGDEIMFSSCYAEAIARAGRGVIECEPRLARLFARSFPQARVIAQPRHGAHPELEASREIVSQVHAGSLPKFFRREREAFPRHTGYLQPDGNRTDEWRRDLRGGAGKRRIGIAWRGGLSHTRRSLRSIPPATFAALLRLPGFEFVSLQHDDDGAEAAELSRLAEAPVHVFPAALADLDDTAALMSSLDGVLSVCSTVVHLAGALGVATLVLTPKHAEWRYLREGPSLPWYPSVRLVRQRHSGDWSDVIRDAREALAATAG